SSARVRPHSPPTIESPAWRIVLPESDGGAGAGAAASACSSTAAASTSFACSSFGAGAGGSAGGGGGREQATNVTSNATAGRIATVYASSAPAGREFDPRAQIPESSLTPRCRRSSE